MSWDLRAWHTTPNPVPDPVPTASISVVAKQCRGRGWRLFKGAESAQKALQGSETETRDVLEEQKRKVFPDKGSVICPPGKSMIFYLSVPPSILLPSLLLEQQRNCRGKNTHASHFLTQCLMSQHTLNDVEKLAQIFVFKSPNSISYKWLTWCSVFQF